MNKPDHTRPADPVDWRALAARAPAKGDEDRVTWEELRAIELERIALEDAIRRTIAQGEAEVKPRYQPPRTVLANPYLPAACTVALLLLLRYLGSP